MTNTQQNKLDSDLETIRLLYAVHEGAHAMIAKKNNIEVPFISSMAHKFSATMCPASIFLLPIEDRLDLIIAGLVAVDLFKEKYGEEDCYDLIKDKHAENDIMWINNLIKHNKKSTTPIKKSATKIKKEAYDRTYKYLEPRFSSIVAMGYHLSNEGFIDSDGIDRYFDE